MNIWTTPAEQHLETGKTSCRCGDPFVEKVRLKSCGFNNFCDCLDWTALLCAYCVGTLLFVWSLSLCCFKLPPWFGVIPARITCESRAKRFGRVRIAGLTFPIVLGCRKKITFLLVSFTICCWSRVEHQRVCQSRVGKWKGINFEVVADSLNVKYLISVTSTRGVC